jgi:hypothetical protein
MTGSDVDVAQDLEKKKGTQLCVMSGSGSLSLATIARLQRIIRFLLATFVIVALVLAVAFAAVSQTTSLELCLFVQQRAHWPRMNCSVATSCDSVLLSRICDTLPGAAILDCNGTAVAGAPWPQLLSTNHLLELSDALSIESVSAEANATVVAAVSSQHKFNKADPSSVANWRAENAALIGSKLNVVLAHSEWDCALQLAGHEAIIIIWSICAGGFVFCLELAFVLWACKRGAINENAGASVLNESTSRVPRHTQQRKRRQRRRRRREAAHKASLAPAPSAFASAGSGRDECTVCLEVFASGDKCIHLPCAHVFHSACLDAWLQNAASCPTCRHQVNTDHGPHK